MFNLPTHHSQTLTKLTLLLIIFLLGSQPILADTEINGLISGSLTLADSPYIVTGVIEVAPGDTLTVEPGVVVKFNPGLLLRLNGTMLCQGTSEAPVLFTSIFGDPLPAQHWRAIYIGDNSIVKMTHTWIEYAGNGSYSGFSSTGGVPEQVSFDGGGVRYCLTDGMDFSCNLVELRNLLIHDNGGDGLAIYPTLPPVLQNIQSNNNAGYAMRINQNPGDILTGLSGTNNGYNGIRVTGTLGGSESERTWNWAANPNFPVIVAYLTINGNNRLLLAAGSVVKFNGVASRITCTSGHLESEADPGGKGFTWLTSLKDDSRGGDTNGDGPSSGSRGDWKSIFMQDLSTLNLRDAFVSYGGNSGNANVTTTSGVMTSVNWNGGGTVSSGNAGMRLRSNISNLTNLTMDDNYTHGFEINSTVPAVLTDLNINNNGTYCGMVTANPGNMNGTITGTGSSYNGIYLTGTLGGEQAAQKWSWASSATVPLIVANVSVVGNDTLSIAPGTVVKFANTASSISVTDGTVYSPGGTPVWFTSIRDDSHGGDTNGDGSATSPAPGNWQSVFLQNNSRVDISDLNMAYGGASGYANMTTTSGVITSFKWDGGGSFSSQTDGARVRTNIANISNLTLGNNLNNGFEINSDFPAEFDNIVANNNGSYGLKVTSNPGNLPNNLTGSGNGFNGAYVSGTLGGQASAGDWTWSTAGNFPAIIGNVSVTGSDTLSVTEGSVVKFTNSESSISVTNGLIRTMGGDPVWFTSLKDDAHGGDTNNDGSSSSPAPGDWQSVFMQDHSVGDLNNFWLAYGGASGYANMTTTSGVIDNFSWDGGGTMGSGTDGARIHASKTILQNLIFEENLQDGFELNSDTPAEYANIVANNNGLFGVRVTQNPGNIPSSFSGFGNGINGVYVTGILGGGADDQNWTWSGGPSFPVVVGSVSASANDTLSISEGAVIKFNNPGSSLNLTSARLQTAGGAPAWFTSLKDDAHGGDTNGDGSATSPQPGDWFSVFMQNDSEADLNNLWFAYGGNSGFANLTTTSGVISDFSWTGGGTAYSANDGVRINCGDISIDQIRVLNNQADGLQLATQTSSSVQNSSFTGNGALAIRNGNNSLQIAASDNWWGDASGPYDPTDGFPDYNPSGLGQPVSDYVDYRPWLSSAPINGAPGSFRALLPTWGKVFNSGPIDFTWTNSIDPDGDAVIYTLEISRTAQFDDIYFIRGGISALATTIDASELELNHTSYWRLIARDGFFNETSADPGIRAIIFGESLSPVPEDNQFAFRVGKVWPNPSSLTSSMAFSLPKNQNVRLQVFDVRGRLVQTLLDDGFEAGEHVVHWDGRDRTGSRAANGLYFYRLQTESGQRVRRMIMIR